VHTGNSDAGSLFGGFDDEWQAENFGVLPDGRRGGVCCGGETGRDGEAGHREFFSSGGFAEGQGRGCCGAAQPWDWLLFKFALQGAVFSTGPMQQWKNNVDIGPRGVAGDA